jgi:hypothetical protein
MREERITAMWLQGGCVHFTNICVISRQP